MNAFNQYGEPDDRLDIESAGWAVENVLRKLYEQMINLKCSPTDIRAASAYLLNVMVTETNNAVATRAEKISQLRIATVSLNEYEIAQLKEGKEHLAAANLRQRHGLRVEEADAIIQEWRNKQ